MDSDYMKRVKDVVKINQLYYLREDDIWEMLNVSKAIIFDGHFGLLSGKHSDMFFRFAAISQFPHFVAKISKEMVEWLKHTDGIPNIDVVLGPTSQGMFFAYDIARELNGDMGTRAVYATCDKETGKPRKELAEGFEITPKESVLIVNDMTTTGNGIETLIKITENSFAQVLAVCLFANRGVHEEKVEKMGRKYRVHSIIDLDMPSWDKNECSKRCLADKQIIESKRINHLPIYSVEDAYERLVQ